MIGHGMLRAAAGGGRASYRAMVIADGASHAWFFDEVAGTSAVDAIGAANGSYVGAPLFSQPGVADVKAIQLNGSSQFVSNSQDLILNTNFTYEILCKTINKGGCLIQANNTGDISPSLYDKNCYINSSGQIIFGIYNGGVKITKTTKIISDGVFHHIVISMGTTSCNIYIDGSISANLNYVSSASAKKPVFGAGSLYSWPESVSNYFNGYIASPAVYPFAMSQSMAAAHAAVALG